MALGLSGHLGTFRPDCSVTLAPGLSSHLSLGGQSIAFKGSLTQHLPSTWQIAALYSFLAKDRNENRNLCGASSFSRQKFLRRASQPEFLRAKTSGSSSRQRRRHLDVEGGRKREEPSWRGRRGRGAGSQEPSWWQPLRVCLLVGQTLLCFNCYILQKKLSQDLRSPISSRPNKRDYSPVLGVYWSAD